MPFYLILITLLIASTAHADSLDGLVTRKSDHCAPISHYKITVRKRLDNLSLEDVASASSSEQQKMLTLLQSMGIQFSLKKFENSINQRNTDAGTYDYWNVVTNGIIEFDTAEDTRKAFITLNNEGYKTNMDISTETPSMCR